MPAWLADTAVLALLVTLSIGILATIEAAVGSIALTKIRSPKDTPPPWRTEKSRAMMLGR